MVWVQAHERKHMRTLEITGVKLKDYGVNLCDVLDHIITALKIAKYSENKTPVQVGGSAAMPPASKTQVKSDESRHEISACKGTAIIPYRGFNPRLSCYTACMLAMINSYLGTSRQRMKWTTLGNDLVSHQARIMNWPLSMPLPTLRQFPQKIHSDIAVQLMKYFREDLLRGLVPRTNNLEEQDHKTGSQEWYEIPLIMGKNNQCTGASSLIINSPPAQWTPRARALQYCCASIPPKPIPKRRQPASHPYRPNKRSCAPTASAPNSRKAPATASNANYKTSGPIASALNGGKAPTPNTNDITTLPTTSDAAEQTSTPTTNVSKGLLLSLLALRSNMLQRNKIMDSSCPGQYFDETEPENIVKAQFCIVLKIIV
ncbi:hypothetical protein FPV67DRAFT_1451982 [Lyophyllum atratum]|nr:hypothetical protein FPV67DRAFT_1451982 [Lyophyllum atratum]